METIIKVKSSSTDEIYSVIFQVDNDVVKINCNCNAGIMKTLCKHRLNLLEGDISAIIDQSDIVALADILNIIDKTKIADLYLELNKVEKELNKLNLLRKKLRKDIGLKFSNGF